MLKYIKKHWLAFTIIIALMSMGFITGPSFVNLILTDSSGSTIGPTNPMSVTDLYGVPSSFSAQTSNGDNWAIQKGVLNKLRLRPQVLNEHAESSREIQGTVTSSQEIVGQIFRASQDNINGIDIALQSAAAEAFDDFEGYAASANLQVEWVETDASDKATLEETIKYEGNKAMRLPGAATVGDEWKRDFSPAVNFSGYTGQFWMYASHAYSATKLRVFVEDGSGNTSSTEIVTVDDDGWYQYVVDVDLLGLGYGDVGALADLTNIVAIGFRLEDRRNASYFYIDKMVSVPGPGTVDVKLWHMGSVLPSGHELNWPSYVPYEYLGDLGITANQLSAVSVQLLGGFRVYHLDGFVAGTAKEISTNQPITAGDYFAITIHYVDTDASVYGPNTSYSVNYYESGYAFTADDVDDPITAIGTYSDLMFAVYSTQDVYLVEYEQITNEIPNGSTLTSIYVEDINMSRQDTTIVTAVKARQNWVIDRRQRPIFMGPGAKLEQEYNDDITDSVSGIDTLIKYVYEPPVTND